jgi:hypothetical protein
MAPSKKKRKQPSLSSPSRPLDQPDSSLLALGEVDSRKSAHPSKGRKGRTHTNAITCKIDPLVDNNDSSDVFYVTSKKNFENESNAFGAAMMEANSETSNLDEWHGTYWFCD